MTAGDARLCTKFFPSPADGGTARDLYIQQDKFREFFAADVGSRR